MRNSVWVQLCLQHDRVLCFGCMQALWLQEIWWHPERMPDMGL
jgi:hypothetical protein